MRGGMVVPLAPPPIIGLGTGGGFTFVLQDVRWRRSEGACAWLCVGCWSQRTKTHSCRGYSARSRRRIRRSISMSTVTRRRSWACRCRTIFQTLQANPGRRLCQRYEPVRPHLAGAGPGGSGGQELGDDIYRLNVRNQKGEMIPLRSLVEVKVVQGPQGIIRYNNKLAVTIQGSRRTRRVLRRGAGGHGCCCRADAAVRLSRRLDRHGVPGKARRGSDDHHPRLRGAVRVPVPGGAV